MDEFSDVNSVPRIVSNVVSKFSVCSSGTVIIRLIWFPALSEIAFMSKSDNVFDNSFLRSSAEISVWIVMDVPPVRETSLLIMSPVMLENIVR